ncbi:hypothetical protein LCGC14_1186010 [marine sediment metagenome]|uniref:GGDEF domain-containing protein n=1 Tax=marine sediment metagenome TaxID=412755 RepID=A0A0F9LKQ7_9ZZZZ
MALMQKAKDVLVGKSDLAVEMADSYRLLLVTKARWLIIGLLAVHWVISFPTYVIAHHFGKSNLYFIHMFEHGLEMGYYPSTAIFAAIVLNTFFHIGWHKLPSLWSNRARAFIHIQIFIDILIVLTLIHFTGGITSWLWPLFLIINLELIYLFSSNIRIVFMGIMAGVGYTILVALEYNRVLAVYHIPYLPQNMQYNPTLVILILIWVNLIAGFSLFITLYMRKGEQREIKERIIRDGLTNLYDKKYFNDRLNSEIQRSHVFNRVFSLILFEIDDYEEYVKNNGRAQADELLRWIGEVLRMNVRRSEVRPVYEFDVAAYLDNAEFVILLPETGAEEKRDEVDIKSDAQIFASGAVTLAEHITSTIKSSKFTYGEDVTVSASIVSFPIDGKDADKLLDAAQKGLRLAQNTGKNKIIVVNQQIEKELSKN